MNDKGVPSLVGLSRSLRKRMTKEERHIWYDFLKGLPQTVKRQEPFGRYIADFYCADARLAIEIDGSRHYSEEGRSKDEERDAFFAGLGIMVLRYTNYEVNTNFEGVCLDIKKHLDGSWWENTIEPPSSLYFSQFLEIKASFVITSSVGCAFGLPPPSPIKGKAFGRSLPRKAFGRSTPCWGKAFGRRASVGFPMIGEAVRCDARSR